MNETAVQREALQAAEKLEVSKGTGLSPYVTTVESVRLVGRPSRRSINRAGRRGGCPGQTAAPILVEKNLEQLSPIRGERRRD